ncbi:3-dehydroquinate synthase [Candidatus Clostridium stratigraminis]|uniref:3-dehydroquinate synthase n=1 Tax=Candidatus Clostridium stratigraminis TaxID=3381661 RepID=A0ABW8T4S6_9CLOT
MQLVSGNSYNICLSNSFEEFGLVVKEYVSTKDKIFVVTDDKIAAIYVTLLKDLKSRYNCQVIVIKNGEGNKNYDTISHIYEFLIEGNADRQSFIMALGGGVVGDLAGFAAATFMRGIRFINIPTSLISQVDSSVGGKVGYNFLNLKNSIGCFYEPAFVYIATDFLTTLNKEEILNGMGEVIKYGLIKDVELFQYIENNIDRVLKLDNRTMMHIIYTCLNIKTKVVKEDFEDKNKRNILNFGHTVGHGLEITSEYEVNHGTAVSLGMLPAIKLSEKILGLPKTVYTRVLNLYSKFGISDRYKVDNYSSFLYAIKHDKKNFNNLNFVLLRNIGQSEIKINVSEDELKWALDSSICKEN